MGRIDVVVRVKVRLRVLKVWVGVGVRVMLGQVSVRLGSSFSLFFGEAGGANTIPCL